MDDAKEFEEKYSKLTQILKNVNESCKNIISPNLKNWKEWKPRDVLACVSTLFTKSRIKFIFVFQMDHHD